METARLIPSSYSLSSTTYLSISDASNMYANTDSTTYATVTHNRANTTAYYLYIYGFNFGSIPSDAIVSSFTIKLKGSESGLSTNATYRMSLYNSTTSISNTTVSASLTTTATTYTFPNGSLTWNTLNGYGNNFRIRVPLRRNASNTACSVQIYGAEIEVQYTIPIPRTITTTLTGDGTIVPSGTTTYYDGDTFSLTITPTTKSDEVTLEKDGVDITSQLVPHGGEPERTDSTNLGSYQLVSGGFNGSGATYFSGIVGKGANGSTTSSNYYSSASGTIAVFTYEMGIEIPSNATITRVYVQVNGHAESTSNANEYMCAMLISGSTELSSELNFKSVGTSNSTQTIEATTLPTIDQLALMKLRCRLGYYGGAINGATAYVEYTVPTIGADYYTYSYTVSGDATFAVAIGVTAQPKLYVKKNNVWKEVESAYKKVNGTWVLQSDVTTVFTSGTYYVNGD